MAEDHGARLGTWVELVRRARIHKDLKYAALIFATYAASDGEGIHCSQARFAVDLDVDLRTARRRLKWLRDVGLVEMTKRGNRRRGLADEYRLTAVPDLTEKHLDAPDPEAYRELIGQVAEAERRHSSQEYRRRKAASSPDSTSDRRSPVDNSAPRPEEPETSPDSTSDRRSGFHRTDREFSPDKPNSLTCEDEAHTSHDYTLHGQDNLPCGADTGRSTSYRPHAREAQTTPIHRTGMDPETAAKYRAAADALMTLADFGLGIRATIREQLGHDAPEHEVVIRAAERFTRRTG